jgi:hypothetical protein
VFGTASLVSWGAVLFLWGGIGHRLVIAGARFDEKLWPADVSSCTGVAVDRDDVRLLVVIDRLDVARPGMV